MTNKPNYICYNVQPRKNSDDFWQRIGGAFEFTTKDGEIGVRIPDLNLVLMPPKPETDAETTD